MNRGILYGLGAYLIWGFLPIWLKQLKSVPALQILGHRIVWSLVFLTVIVIIRRRWTILYESLESRRTMTVYILAAALLSVNWMTYIYAINADRVIESSLGYFINPLVNVVFGVVFFRERLRRWQWVPVGIAAVGVVYLTVDYGHLPWIALTLALTFALYAVVKKVAPLGPLSGLTTETAILVIPAAAYLVFVEINGTGVFSHSGMTQIILLMMAGFVTAVPLLLFGAAARLIPLTTIGILQYLAPSCQFLLGVIVYHEPFSISRLLGFSIVWTALVIFAIEGIFNNRHKQKKVMITI